MRRATDPKHNRPHAPGRDDPTAGESTAAGDSTFVGAHVGGPVHGNGHRRLTGLIRVNPGARPREAGKWRIVALLFTMTALTGLVDSLTFLGLGEVFVANMTGNVVVLGFSLADPRGISGVLSLNALTCFIIGALIGGRIGAWSAHHPRAWLGTVTAVQTALVTAALAVVVVWLHPSLDLAADRGGQLRDEPSTFADYVLVSTLAIAMGLQHATAQRLARPEIPTNVLTTAITMFAIQTRAGGGQGSQGLRQAAGPAVMFASAGAGALGFFRVSPLMPLCCGLALALASLALAVTPPPLARSGARPAPMTSLKRPIDDGATSED
ncbi:Uncharacterized membrane protein YoaK, UPF0700 family [Parafrankia irregularis]|uniref:Uncharacterized membrane protein YoaK, UPF0700 family n=1 Tax=Parafrankia irregularis TaxID=795642 RepID=A0A0S4QYN8_9ACTN|nr:MULTISPECIES: YoaK family protein [Parafrankia]CUU60044.1 Uncharacterized membrane protein YoaK, UPF0700 family [Parafrankia irregularis]